jgi:hypothetical protein
MAIPAVYKLYAVRYQDTGIPIDVVIPAMMSGEATTQAEIEREVLPGSIHPKTSIFRLTQAALNFETKQVRAALNGLGLSAQCMSATQTLTLYFALYDCNKIVTAGPHLAYAINRGVLFPRQLQANHQADAMIGYGVVAVYDGSNAPIVRSEPASLPDIAPADDDSHRWHLYTSTINGQVAVGKKTFSIDWTANVQTDGADNEDYDSVAVLDSLLPQVSLGGVDPTWFHSGATPSDGLQIPLAGLTISRSNTEVVLKKRNVVPATAEHIDLQFGGPAHFPTIISAQNQQLPTTQFRVDPIQEGANLPVTFAIDQATT